MLHVSRQAAKLLGLHPNTLRKYADNGLIKHIRTPSGQRLYDVDSFTGSRSEPTTVCYCRVSSAGQRDDLESQVEFMRKSYPHGETVKDIGSGLNFKRKGLRAVLERAVSGERIRFVVAHRDRVARFGHELVQWVIEKAGGEFLVHNTTVRTAEQELAEDILKILHVFSCRMYGKRRYRVNQDEANTSLAYCGTEALVAQLVRRISSDFQLDRGAVESTWDESVGV